jgi:hydroxyacylglutathione hydrolase
MISMHAIPALKDNYIWAIVNETYQTALIVDPGDAEPVLQYLQHHHLTLAGILITHHHWDHSNGLASLIKKIPVPVIGSIHSPLSGLTKQVGEGLFSMSSHFPDFQGILIPGHTLDHIAYYMQDALFCGDTLFAGGCGRLFEGTAKQLYTSLQTLSKLPLHTQIHCGHEYTLDNLRFAQLVEPNNQAIVQRIKNVSTLRKQGHPSLPSFLYEEIETNPFLRCEVPDIIEHVEAYAQCRLNHPVEVFRVLREWKNTI